MCDTTKGSTNAEKKFIPADLFEIFFFLSIRYFLKLGLCEGTL